jgi:hypothetical protein
MGASWLHSASSIRPHQITAVINANGACPVARRKTQHPILRNRSALKTAHNNLKCESCAAPRDAARILQTTVATNKPGDGVIKITDDPIKVRQIKSLPR